MVAEETVFSIDDVNQRLPLVKAIVTDIVSLHADLAFRRQRLLSLRERHPAQQSDSVYEQEVQQMEIELSEDEVQLEQYSDELLQIGGTLTDGASGRVDFPGELSGERVYFCWQIGEAEVLYWHVGECVTTDRISLLQEMSSGDSTGEHEAER